MVELRKNEELEWLKQMAMGREGFSLPPLSDSAKQALGLILPQFSPSHRMLLASDTRSWMNCSSVSGAEHNYLWKFLQRQTCIAG
jgi:hypothetical protein